MEVIKVEPTGEAKVIEGAFRKGDDLSLWRIDRVPGAVSRLQVSLQPLERV